MSGPSELDEGLSEMDKAFRVALTAANQLVEFKLMATNAKQRRELEAARREPSRASAQYQAARATARAAYVPALQQSWWESATIEDAARAWVGADAWGKHDPDALRAQPIIVREAQARWGVDIAAVAGGYKTEWDSSPATDEQVSHMRGVGLYPDDAVTLDEATTILTAFENDELQRGDVDGARRLIGRDSGELVHEGPSVTETPSGDSPDEGHQGKTEPREPRDEGQGEDSSTGPAPDGRSREPKQDPSATDAQKGYLEGTGLHPGGDVTVDEARAILTAFENKELQRGDVDGARRVIGRDPEDAGELAQVQPPSPAAEKAEESVAPGTSIPGPRSAAPRKTPTHEDVLAATDDMVVGAAQTAQVLADEALAAEGRAEAAAQAASTVTPGVPPMVEIDLGADSGITGLRVSADSAVMTDVSAHGLRVDEDGKVTVEHLRAGQVISAEEFAAGQDPIIKGVVVDVTDSSRTGHDSGDRGGTTAAGPIGSAGDAGDARSTHTSARDPHGVSAPAAETAAAPTQAVQPTVARAVRASEPGFPQGAQKAVDAGKGQFQPRTDHGGQTPRGPERSR